MGNTQIILEGKRYQVKFLIFILNVRPQSEQNKESGWNSSTLILGSLLYFLQ